MKRLFDLVVAVGALLVASPVLFAVAVMIKLDSRGPVLFRQTRVGREGQAFKLLKFRSMVADAASLGGHSTDPGDPRVTRVGKLLRSSSLDELPQFVNVLRGEMSVVGPRPSVPAQEVDYEPADWQRRLSVKPGITGLAQVNGRSLVTPEEQLAWDTKYVDQHGVVDDLRICLMTARQLVRGGTT